MSLAVGKVHPLVLLLASLFRKYVLKHSYGSQPLVMSPRAPIAHRHFIDSSLIKPQQSRVKNDNCVIHQDLCSLMTTQCAICTQLNCAAGSELPT